MIMDQGFIDVFGSGLIFCDALLDSNFVDRFGLGENNMNIHIPINEGTFFSDHQKKILNGNLFCVTHNQDTRNERSTYKVRTEKISTGKSTYVDYRENLTSGKFQCTDQEMHKNGKSAYLDQENLPENSITDNSLMDLPFFSSDLSSNTPEPTNTNSPGIIPGDDEIFSDVVLNYINQMLMEGDIEEKTCMYQDCSAIEAAEKPFSDILNENHPPSPNQPPLCVEDYSESTDGSSIQENYSDDNISRNNQIGIRNNCHVCDCNENLSLQDLVTSEYSSGSLLCSSDHNYSIMDGLYESLLTSAHVSNFLVESQPIWQFNKGMEEAQKFLPNGNDLVIDLEKNVFGREPGSFEVDHSFFFPQEISNGELSTVPDKYDKEDSVQGSRVRKNPLEESLDLEERRSNKQCAYHSDVSVSSEMFDKVLLCAKCDGNLARLRESLQSEVNKKSREEQSKRGNGSKNRKKRQSGKKEVIDLRTILIHCAQAVGADDQRNANELLKKIRENSSPVGDGTQRLAHCFADGLEARLAGTGNQIYMSLSANMTASGILKAYQLYVAACPFKRLSHFFANQTILNVAENAPKLHIIDFGVYYGFQWPCLIQRLSTRTGGPPKLRITGIDFPQPGFRPRDRIEETGKRLADYAQRFNVPFEYIPIASKWESVKVEDLKINKDEVLVVNCLYRLKNLLDETVIVDSPRNMVLNLIRKLNPDIFIHGVVNGAYGAPFFVTRFREALFHFSAIFDMLETNVPRDNAERMVIERQIFGREALNVIACEGSERVERPETYKQWQVRTQRAGFKQLPLDPDIMKKSIEKVKVCGYHKDFIVDEDSRWMLQGWKGRVIYALSTWKPQGK